MSAEITEQDTRKVASLARLALSDQEIALYRVQLARVLEHAADLEALDVSSVGETTHVLGGADALRADDSEVFENAEAVRAQAPAFGNDHFLVPRVVE